MHTHIRRVSATLAGFTVIALLAFVAATARAQDASIRVGGSAPALPIISSCAAHSMEK